MPEAWFPNIGIQINKLNDTAFTIFSLEIKWYAICIMLGIVAGYILMTKEVKRTKQNIDYYDEYLGYALIGAIVGARLYYVAFSFDTYKNNLLEILNIRGGGLAIYGGIIGAIIVSIIYTKKRKIKLTLFLDTLAPSLALGQFIGRWGNFINKEAFGGYTNNLFALRYMESQVSSQDLTPDILQNIVTVNNVSYIQVHPTFLYESFLNLCIAIVLYNVLKHKKFDGQVAALYFVLYGVGRAFIEGLRTDQLLLFNTSIAVSQMLSILLAILGLAYIKIKKGNVK